jgi:hypothetical protein
MHEYGRYHMEMGKRGRLELGNIKQRMLTDSKIVLTQNTKIGTLPEYYAHRIPVI